MTVRLEFRSGKAAGVRQVVPLLAKAIFTGMAALPLVFLPPKGSAAVPSGRPSLERALPAPLTDTQSLFHPDSTKMTTEAVIPCLGRRTERVIGVDVEVDRPGFPLRQLGSAGYKVTESRSWRGPGMVHQCTLVNESDTFSVTTNLREGKMQVSLRFKKENDRYKVPQPGTRSFEADSFVSLVRSLPQDPRWAGLGVSGWSATKIFLEQVDSDIKSAFFVPVDSRGRAVTALGEGRYLVFSLVYYAGCIVHAQPKVIYEKGGDYSIPTARKD